MSIEGALVEDGDDLVKSRHKIFILSLNHYAFPPIVFCVN